MYVITRSELLFVEPAANAVPLKCIVETPRKEVVTVVIADKARVKLNRLVQDRGKIRVISFSGSPQPRRKASWRGQELAMVRW